MSTRIVRVVLVATAVVPSLLPSLGHADAPPDQYEPYLSTDPTLTDDHTDLIWERRDFTGALLLAEAHCRDATARFPTVKELATLLDNQPTTIFDTSGAPQPLYIDPNALPGTPAALFWTSSMTPDGGVFVVDFGTGEIWVTKQLTGTSATKAHVRCVKNG